LPGVNFIKKSAGCKNFEEAFLANAEQQLNLANVDSIAQSVARGLSGPQFASRFGLGEVAQTYSSLKLYKH
jgi:hypothetical protein